MHFMQHSALVGVHAPLSPSNYHWVNYDDEKLAKIFETQMAARRGTDLHAFAAEAIRLRIKLPEDNKTLSMYVNDAIGFRMESEIPLRYSDHCFGTVDTIQFFNNTLRIHDLKNGVLPASWTQLELYAALFCLEYLMNPFKIKMELRIYQNDEVKILTPDADDIFHLMEKIKYVSKIMDELREEVGS